MFQVKLNLVPAEGAYREEGLRIPLAELGLSEPFQGDAVEADYELRRLEDKVLGSFRLRGTLRLVCARCLEEFEQPAQTEFVVEFARRPPEGSREQEAGDPGPNRAWFEGEELPVGEEMRQEMELLVPLAPRCRDACQGLCPQCGANLNATLCGCKPHRAENPFSILKALFPRSEEI